jgi:hypothetical protein
MIKLNLTRRTLFVIDRIPQYQQNLRWISDNTKWTTLSQRGVEIGGWFVGVVTGNKTHNN